MLNDSERSGTWMLSRVEILVIPSVLADKCLTLNPLHLPPVLIKKIVSEIA